MGSEMCIRDRVNGLNIHVEKMEDQRVESALVSKILPEKEEEE